MLLAMMERMFALSQMHNAQYSIMRNRMNMMNTMRNLPSFYGNMSMLAKMDEQYAINQAQSETLYLIASAQEKAAKQRIAQEQKNYKISYTA